MIKLTTTCSSCKNGVTIKSSATTRPELQMKKGNEIKIQCKSCGNIEKKHINDIKAESNIIFTVIGITIGAIATIFLWVFFGAIAVVSFVIPLLFWQQQMSAKRAFNSYMIRRK